MGGGGGDTGTATQTTQIQLPKWVEQASQSNYDLAQRVASRPFEQYGGETVAALSPQYWQALGYAPNLEAYQGNYGAASGALQGLLGYNPNAITAGSVRAGTLPQTDLNSYLNPYIRNVEDRAIAAAERSGQEAQNRLRTEAQQAGAFGGSRQAIQQAVQQAETARRVGDISAELRKGGYDTATALAQADLDRQLQAGTISLQTYQQAQQQNEANRQAAAGIRAGAAGQLADVATAGQSSVLNTIQGLLGLGQIAEQKQQQYMDRDAARWQAARDYPLEQLNILLSSLGMSPYGRTETSTKTQEEKGGIDFGGILGGALQLAPLFFKSDRRDKTDIERMGTDPQLELPVYAFRYKKDPKTYPKVVGYMAQDVEKKYPRAVKRFGGRRAIDLTALELER